MKPLARKNDPATSHEAAARAQTFAATHRAKIYYALTEYGQMNAMAISHATKLCYVAVQRRGRELERDGLIRRGPDTYNNMKIWRAIRK